MKDKKDKLQQELDWFRDFGYKVNELSSSVNNKACKYADAMNEMTLDKLKEKLMYYYEVDINNCKMTDEDWIEELARSMLYDDYKETFFKAYEEYVQERKP